MKKGIGYIVRKLENGRKENDDVRKKKTNRDLR